MSTLSKNTPETTTPQPTSILPATTLSAVELKQQLESIPLTKENAIKMIVFSNVLKSFVEEAKDYLTTRCKNCDDGNYTTGQMSLKLIEGSKTSYTNEKIEKLEAEIKKEKEKIKSGKSKGEITETKYNSFKVQYQ